MLFLLCAGLAGCGQAQGEESPPGLLGELARALDGSLALAPRLSIAGPQGPCRPREASSSSDGARRCTDASSSPETAARVAALAVRAEQAVRDEADPQAMHAAALIDLLYDGGGGKSLGRSISSLQTAARLSDRPADVLADLAAAYLVRAEREGTPRDLLAAAEAAEQALAQEPGHRGARYNLALALERFGLMEEAADEWRAYAGADSTSGWGMAARVSLRALAALPGVPPPPAPDADERAWAAFAAAAPQEGAEHAWCGLLGTWGEAVQAGDAAAAERQLRRVEAVGRALAARSGGDQGVRDAAAAIRAHGSPAERERLAAAHREFAAGCGEQDRAEFRAAERRFAAAAASADGSPALAAWARLLHGRMVFYGGDRHRGEQIFRDVAERTDTARYPALAGRSRLLLSALLLRTDRYDAAVEQARLAVPLFQRSGEGENEGAALDAISVAEFGRRDMDRGYAMAHRALAGLRPYRASYRLHNLLTLTGRIVADDGLPRAALRMQDEGVRVAVRTTVPAFVAEAHLGRAGLRARIGDLAGARDDAAVGYRSTRTLHDPKVRGWMLAQWRIATSAFTVAADPVRAGEALDSAASFYLQLGAPYVGLAAVVGGAEARLAAGQGEAARARLQTALELLEHRRNAVRMEPRRAAVFETARGVVDRITTLELAAGRTAEALGYLDRGRASLAAVGRPARPASGSGVSGPPGEVALVFAMLGDTLLAWTVAGDRIELFRTPVDTMQFMRRAESLRQQLEAGASESELRPALGWFHDRLLGPATGELGAPGTPLVIVADGTVASVPFAALFDSARGRYLVQDHPLRFASSLWEARRGRRSPAGGAAPLFVAHPAFDSRTHPAFERLTGAAGEVRDMSAVYGSRRTLAGAGATKAALRGALGRAGVLHYAGHAVFDDERPERSYLLLAADGPDPAAGTLYAREIAEMDLRHVSVVVLSACRTVRTGSGRAAGLTGLAGAFLAAGAGGAVGSLWEVNDVRTGPLMLAFHREYERTGSGSVSLRAAQVELLRSRDPALRTPATWAAFRYVGG